MNAIGALDQRYFTTDYAIGALNFVPANLSSALDELEAPYLPLVVHEAAGVPLDPTFSEQKRILERCHGLFYRCAGGRRGSAFQPAADRSRPDHGALRTAPLRYWPWPTRT